MMIDEKNAEYCQWGDGCDRLQPLTDEAVPNVKALIADAVLEFYGDLEFLPKDRDGLLLHYERTGYLRDLDDLPRYTALATAYF